jgi:hypothetical protein
VAGAQQQQQQLEVMMPATCRLLHLLQRSRAARAELQLVKVARGKQRSQRARVRQAAEPLAAHAAAIRRHLRRLRHLLRLQTQQRASLALWVIMRAIKMQQQLQ